MRKLNEKQERFCLEYLADLNATQAAIRAGYSRKTAGAIGNKLLKKVEIQVKVSELQQERAKRTEVTVDRVVEELAKIAFADLKHFVHWTEHGVEIHDSEDVDGAVLSEVSETVSVQVFPNGGESEKRMKRVKLHDKMKALEMLGRHLSMFKDRTEVQHTGAVEFVDDIGVDDS